MPVTPATQSPPYPGRAKRQSKDFAPLPATVTENNKPRGPPNARLAHSLDDVIAITGLGRTTLYAALRSGALRARKLGRRTLVLDGDLRAFLENLQDA